MRCAGADESVPFGSAVNEDRLGSAVKHFPYGEEPATTGQDRVKFATYYRDETTTLDYADQRYYLRTIGRFLTADPYRASAGPADPQSWNRYSYVQGDPVNHLDPSGLDLITIGEFMSCAYSPWNGPWGWLCGESAPTKVYTGRERPRKGGWRAGGAGAQSGGGRRVRSEECEALLPNSPTGDFGGGLDGNILEDIVSLSGGDDTLAALVTVTWWAESRFSYSPANNGVAYGPLQITPGAWDSLLEQAGFDLDDVFGASDRRAKDTSYGGRPSEGLKAGAHILRGLLDRYGERSAAGYYRAGLGPWVATEAGRAAFQGRQRLYDAWTDGTKGDLKRFFRECVK